MWIQLNASIAGPVLVNMDMVICMQREEATDPASGTILITSNGNDIIVSEPMDVIAVILDGDDPPSY